MCTELACGSSLKPDPSLDSGRARLVDEEARLPVELRAKEDSIAEIGVLSGPGLYRALDCVGLFVRQAFLGRATCTHDPMTKLLSPCASAFGVSNCG